MARLAYECNEQIRANLSDESTAMKPFACTSDKYCLYCCCNPQCCLLVQRKPPRHFWEAWYFWLGIALLVLFVVSSISSFIVSNCRQSFQAMALGHSAHNSGRDDRTRNINEISINVIPTSGMLPSHTKMLLCAPQPSIAHMSCGEQFHREADGRLPRRTSIRGIHLLLLFFFILLCLAGRASLAASSPQRKLVLLSLPLLLLRLLGVRRWGVTPINN